MSVTMAGPSKGSDALVPNKAGPSTGPDLRCRLSAPVRHGWRLLEPQVIDAVQHRRHVAILRADAPTGVLDVGIKRGLSGRAAGISGQSLLLSRDNGRSQ